MTKEINSNDDTFKFFLLIGPTFIAIFLYIRANFFQKFINISDFYKKKVLERKHFHLKNLLYVKLLFFLYILLEFFSLDLSRINYMDTFHDGDYLTPLINHLYYKTFWSSSYTIHGGREIFIPILGYKIFGTINFGIIKFTYNYILIFFVKFFSIILSYQILKFTFLNNPLIFII